MLRPLRVRPSPALVTAALAFAMALWGCNNTPSFTIYGDDAGIECGQGDLTCPSGEVCLGGHCYASCTTGGCGPLESCVGGVCVRLAGDAGVDAGRDAPTPDVPPDPCIGMMCMAPTPYCRDGDCVPCTLAEEACGGTTPICLVARSSCVGTTGTLCEPCNDDFDCMGGNTCEVIGVAAQERVCVPACTGGCPMGTTCMGTTCRPTGGVSCFQYRAVVTGAVCTTDADCAPQGATIDEALIVGSCNSMTCRFPCGVAADCPTGTCLPTGFCG